MESLADFEVVEDIRQSKEYAGYIKSIGWSVIRTNGISIFLRKFLGLKIAKIQRTKGVNNWDYIFNILKREKVFSLRWEPLTGNKPKDFGISTWPLIGTKTLRINLKPSIKKIYDTFKKDCRYTLRKYSMFNIQCSIDKFDVFYKIWKMEGKRKKLWIPSYIEYQNLIKNFGNKIFCLTCEDLGGVVVLLRSKTAYYYYSACLPEGKNMQLPYLLVWKAMKIAKKKGCIVWDFEGIYDERWPNSGWKGFSHFKKSFGGKEVLFPGSFQKWLWPF